MPADPAITDRGCKWSARRAVLIGALILCAILLGAARYVTKQLATSS